MPNLIVLNDEIGWGNSSAWSVREKLDEFQGQPVKVEINSPGGSVVRGLEIFHLFKNYLGFVHMHIMSLAASMASIIPLAGNKITAEETTIWVIHNVFGGEWGDYRDLQKEADVLLGLRDMMANLYSKRLNKDIKIIKKLMDDETFFFGDEALKIGLVDEIIMLPEKDKENKSDSIAYAKIRIEDCNKKRRLEENKEDIEKVASLIKIENKTFEKVLDKKNSSDLVEEKEIISANADQNKKQEASNMDLEQLKNEHPSLCNSIYNEGVTAGINNERVRVTAHLDWLEYSPDIVNAAIREGQPFNIQNVSSYSKAMLNKQDSQSRIDENPDSVETPDVVSVDDAVDDLTSKIVNGLPDKKGVANV